MGSQHLRCREENLSALEDRFFVSCGRARGPPCDLRLGFLAFYEASRAYHWSLGDVGAGSEAARHRCNTSGSRNGSTSCVSEN